MLSDQGPPHRRAAAPVFTESEVTALVALLFGTSVMSLPWLADAVGLTIRPLPILITALLATVVSCALAGVRRTQVEWSAVRFGGCAALVLGSIAYLGWLAWPSLLPISDGPDLVHHLSLIHFIQQRHLLLHDHALGAYLGEMDGYTPGSHLLAALVADWLGLDGLRVVHPLAAFAVAIKIGLVYNIISRVLPSGRACAPAAVAGSLLLFVPHAYLLRSFTYYYFYSQVVAETFAVAMLWTLVAWHQQLSRTWLALFGVFGVAVALCWPVWLPAPMIAMALTVVVRRDRSPGERLVDLAVAAAPALAVMVVYAATHAASAAVLSSGGSTLVPRVTLFGWPFLVLAAAGGLIAIARRVALAPICWFTLACLAQIAGLVVLQRALGASNYYLAYKTVHLLVYPATIYAAIALAAAWQLIWGALPWLRKARVAGLALPVLVIAWLARVDLPAGPIASPITDPVHRAGLWARSHLPAPCVDYLTEHWLTGYWLHIDVLGNPRQSERMRHEGFGYDRTIGKWIEPGSLPFAIVGDLAALPDDVTRNIRVLERFGPAAVVERIDGKSACHDTTPPIHQVEIRRQ